MKIKKKEKFWFYFTPIAVKYCLEHTNWDSTELIVDWKDSEHGPQQYTG